MQNKASSIVAIAGICVITFILAALAVIVVKDVNNTRKVLSTDIVSSQEYQVVWADTRTGVYPSTMIISGKTTVSMQTRVEYYTILELDGTRYEVTGSELYEWAKNNETAQLDTRFSDGTEYVCFGDSIVTLVEQA